MAKNIDMYIDQGSDFTATFPPVTSSTGGNAVDLTGYTVVCQIRRSYATVYAVQMTVDTSQLSSGVITISLANTETAGLTPTRYVYDVTIEDQSGLVTKVFEGLATVESGTFPSP